MPQAQAPTALVEEITVTAIDGPRLSAAGRMMPAKVRDSRGRVWNVWKDKFEEMDIAIGKTYAAMYTSREYEDDRGKPRTDLTIVGLNPMTPTQTAVPSAQAQAAQPREDRTEDIAVQGISHCPEIAAAAAEGDVAKGVKILRTLRLIWREYKKQSVITPSGGAEFDDEIPY